MTRIMQGAPGLIEADQCSPAVGVHIVMSREIAVATETVTQETFFSPPWPCYVKAARWVWTVLPTGTGRPTLKLGIAGKGTTADDDHVVAAVKLDIGAARTMGNAEWLTIITSNDATTGWACNLLNVLTSFHPEALTFTTTAATNAGKGFVQCEIEPTTPKQRYWPQEWTTTTTTTTSTTPAA